MKVVLLTALLVIGVLSLGSTGAAFGFELRSKGLRRARATLTIFLATLVGFTALLLYVIAG